MVKIVLSVLKTGGVPILNWNTVSGDAFGCQWVPETVMATNGCYRLSGIPVDAIDY